MAKTKERVLKVSDDHSRDRPSYCTSVKTREIERAKKLSENENPAEETARAEDV